MAYVKDSRTSDLPVRKRLKTSDLPLASATRNAIEGLSHTYKKKGGYDSLRQQVWQELENSDFEAEFTRSLIAAAEEELDKSATQLLKLDRSKATLLLEGAVERSGVYSAAEKKLDNILSAHIPAIEASVRKHRADDVGGEVAAAELARGGKTDEQYAEEYAQKRAEREKIRRENRAKEQAVIEERRRIEKAKRLEEERRIEAEQERKKEEKEALKRAAEEEEAERRRKYREIRDRERDHERERERERHRERERVERPRERDYDRERDYARDRERERDRDRDDRHRRHEADSRERSSRYTPELTESKPVLSKEESDRLKKEALDNLINESKRVAEQTRQQPGFRIDRSLVPPPRKSLPASAIMPKDSPISSIEAKPSSNFRFKDEAGFKPPLGPAKQRSPSHDRASVRRSSRSRSRHRRVSDDDKDRESVRSRKDSRERGHRSSKDRDDRRKDRDDHRRKITREGRRRTRSPSRERQSSYRSRSRDRQERDRINLIPRDLRPIEKWKLTEAEKREAEAKAYLAAQAEAREKGLPIPGFYDKKVDAGSTPRHREEGQIDSPVSQRRRDSSRDRERERDKPRSSRARSRSRTPHRRKRERSTSPMNIDRYVPGASSRRRCSPSRRERSRHREDDRDSRRDRERGKDRERRRSRSEERRNRSRSRRRERKERSRSPSVRRERGSRRERSRDTDRDRDRRRDRSRERDYHDRDRERRRSRTRESKRESKRD
ncbi:complex proteins associated with Set1p component shg1-domain-containing protein [Calycina marina]|uniref:Complex proteins associated with Set1p component shg1-domain-containing protein n=1 Tax=Calycina marina TaxID=1763456 RepID=A0A9P7Z705_9HELO|nr:complex proteins associated with Set1p component shg1-domain-containing protein [Calycina marina]